jgi:Tol biopolymer transport system component
MSFHGRLKSFFFFSIAVLLTGIFPDSLWAKVYIDIRSPSFRKFPIAISSFKAPALPGENTNFGERAREILHDDLSLSGFFALLDPKTFVESPARSGESASSSGRAKSAACRRASESARIRMNSSRILALASSAQSLGPLW